METNPIHKNRGRGCHQRLVLQPICARTKTLLHTAVSPSPSLGFMSFQYKSRWIIPAIAAHKRMPHTLFFNASIHLKCQKPDSMKNYLEDVKLQNSYKTCHWNQGLVQVVSKCLSRQHLGCIQGQILCKSSEAWSRWSRGRVHPPYTSLQSLECR